LETVAVLVLLVTILLPIFAADAWTDEGRRAVWVPEGEPPFEVAHPRALHDEITAIVNALEDDAVLFTDWAMLYPFYYVAHVEQGRTNMVFVQRHPALGQTRLADSAVEYIRREARTRPVYLPEPPQQVTDVFSLEPVVRGGSFLFRVGPSIEKPATQSPSH
jgi:hypothetical protein